MPAQVNSYSLWLSAQQNPICPKSGPTGSTGPTGPSGNNGVTGRTGSTGAQGSTGSTGAQGPTGTSGTNGTNGTNGVTGPTGASPVITGTSNSLAWFSSTNTLASTPGITTTNGIDLNISGVLGVLANGSLGADLPDDAIIPSQATMVIAGWRIRWGINETNLYGSLTVSFSTNFSTIPYIYLSQVNPVFNAGDAQKNILAENISISSFDCKLGEDGGGNGGGRFCWLAIGGS